MVLTDWLLTVLALVAGALCLVWWLEERQAEKVTRPVRVALHSLEELQRKSRPDGHTARLTPPPDLKYGGVTGRPRSYFLNDDGEWIGNPHK